MSDTPRTRAIDVWTAYGRDLDVAKCRKGLLAVDEKCAELEQRIAKAQTAWVLLAERQPEMGQVCLVFPDECDEVGMDTFGWDGVRPKFIEDGFTHWMPLPETPK